MQLHLAMGDVAPFGTVNRSHTGNLLASVSHLHQQDDLAH
jgi:hypothetical protein